MKPLLHNHQLQITLQRLAHEVIENHADFSQTVLIGLQPRGIYLANRLFQLLQQILGENKVPYGQLDITFYRDDIHQSSSLHLPNDTHIPFSIENKKVILIDDVLHTGRTIRAALDALVDIGRPKTVELLVLIDRRFSRELPVQPDYVGKSIDSINSQKVKVKWKENDGIDEVLIINAI